VSTGGSQRVSRDSESEDDGDDRRIFELGRGTKSKDKNLASTVYYGVTAGGMLA